MDNNVMNSLLLVLIVIIVNTSAEGFSKGEKNRKLQEVKSSEVLKPVYNMKSKELEKLDDMHDEIVFGFKPENISKKDIESDLVRFLIEYQKCLFGEIKDSTNCSLSLQKSLDMLQLYMKKYKLTDDPNSRSPNVVKFNDGGKKKRAAQVIGQISEDDRDTLRENIGWTKDQVMSLEESVISMPLLEEPFAELEEGLKVIAVDVEDRPE